VPEPGTGIIFAMINQIISMADARSLRALVAPTHAALDRACLNARPRALARFLVELTLAQGRDRCRLLNALQLGRLHGFSESDISEVCFNGYTKRGVFTKSLVAMGIIARMDLPLDRGWVVVLNPNYSRWDVVWMHSVAERRALVRSVAAQTSELERQLAAGDIEWQFPSLAAVLPEADVSEALRLAAVDAGGASCHLAAGDALVANAPGRAGGSSGRVCGVEPKDAPVVCSARLERSGAVRTSEFPKSKSQRIRGGFGNSEVKHIVTRARASSSQSSQRLKASSSLTLSVEQLKNLIRSGDENDFVCAVQSLIPLHENGDGGKWRRRWRVATLKPFVLRAFEGVIEALSAGELSRWQPGARAEIFWRDFGGVQAENLLREKIKESLQSSTKAR
jgi:hypothetical protein